MNLNTLTSASGTTIKHFLRDQMTISCRLPQLQFLSALVTSTEFFHHGKSIRLPNKIRILIVVIIFMHD